MHMKVWGLAWRWYRLLNHIFIYVFDLRKIPTYPSAKINQRYARILLKKLTTFFRSVSFSPFFHCSVWVCLCVCVHAYMSLCACVFVCVLVHTLTLNEHILIFIWCLWLLDTYVLEYKTCAWPTVAVLLLVYSLRVYFSYCWICFYWVDLSCIKLANRAPGI